VLARSLAVEYATPHGRKLIRTAGSGAWATIELIWSGFRGLRGPKMGTRRRLVHARVILLCALTLPAYAGSRAAKSPSEEELARVRAHEAAVVLLRVSEAIDGKVVVPTRTADSNRLPRFFLASLDALDAPKPARVAAPTPTAAEQGWRQLVLSPGTYFLLVLPPGVEQNPPAVVYGVASGRYGRLTDYAFKPGRGGFWSSDLGAFVFTKDVPPDFQALPGFWFEVPHDREVVYLGSLSVTCKGGRGLFGSLIDSCSGFELADESGAASALAASALAGFALETRLLVPYGSLRPAGALHEPQSLPVDAPVATGVGAAFTGARLAPSATLHGVGPAINLYNLLVVGGQLLQQSSDRQRAHEQAARLQPCLDRLSRSVAGLDIAQAFGLALSAAWKSTPGAAAAAPDVVAATAPAPERAAGRRWSIGLPILRLRDVGQPDRLALELGLAVRLGNLDASRTDAYALLVSGPEPPAQDPHAPGSPLYMRFVPERTASRPLDEWCGPEGDALLSADIATALRNIAAVVAHDFD
jgi:hypothetical protein